MPKQPSEPEPPATPREEERLRRSEALLSGALSVANMGTWEYDIAGQCFIFNDQYYRLHDLTVEQAGGYVMDVREFASRWVHPEDADMVADVIRQGVEASDPGFQVRVEGRILRADGQPRWVTAWFRIEKDAAGRTVRLHGVNQDIHERKMAEAEVARSHQELERHLRFTESLLAAIPTPVFFKDAEGRYLGCNRAFTEVMGVTAAEIRGKTVHECWPGEHAEVYHQRDLELMRSPRLQVYDFKVRDRHGEDRDVIYAKNVFRDEADRVAGIVGAFVDITDRKRAELALHDRLAFEALVTGISTQFINLPPGQMDAGIHDALAAIGGFAGVDRSYVFLFRDPPTLMDNTHEWCSESISPERLRLQGLEVADFPSVQEVLRGEVFHVPRVAALPEGSVERAEFEREGIRSLVLVPVKSIGRVLGFLGLDAVRSERAWTADDIALLRIVGEIFASGIERQRAVAALEDREQRLRFITDNMLDILTQTSPDGTLQYLSPSFGRHLGYKPADLLGRSGLRLVHPEDVGPMEAAIRAAFESGAPSCRTEYRFRHAQGHYLWFESTVTILRDEHGVFAGMILASRDISDRKRVEEQLREAQKLESVGRLAAGIAHDFNNMLTPILGYAEMLLLGLGAHDERRAGVEQIMKAAERSRDLTQQLLAFSRKQVLDLRVVDLREVVSGLEGLLRRTLRENVELRILDSQESCPIRADIGQIGQIVLNLAVNAQDAMPDGGTLSIETARVVLDETTCARHLGATPGLHALLTVTDTGHGMDPDTRSRVFEPFFTTKEQGKGTGLGLATVYGIVRQHGGTIWLHSEPQQGTTFEIYLPLVDGAEPAPLTAMPRDPTPPRRSGTVMVVEDDAMVRRLVSEILAGSGCSVLSAGSPDECLERLADHDGPLHLLVTDVIMPGLNGRELFAEVARRYPGIKVLYISGYTRNVIAHHGVLEEGINFLQKPFSVDALLARVSVLLGEG
ncbi:MAG: PAS domain S-box protein [Thermoanaerobaculaceae bacterium]|nr:PAS domain S-box protein [Thermoanaerobaculaceae bacterium]